MALEEFVRVYWRFGMLLLFRNKDYIFSYGFIVIFIC